MQRAQLEAGFCIDVGQVKTGDDKEDTYLKMLQQTVRVTPAVALGVADKYPNVVSLVRGMRKHGPCALEDLEVWLIRFFCEGSWGWRWRWKEGFADCETEERESERGGEEWEGRDGAEQTAVQGFHVAGSDGGGYLSRVVVRSLW